MAKKEWAGLVKNLRKDGRYYWVYSHIAPISNDGKVTGYSAARRPATETEIAEATLLYRKLLHKEKTNTHIR